MIRHEVHRVPVTALAFSDDYLFAGEGPYLRVHRRHDHELLAECKVFTSQAIHGIAVHSNGIVAWGGRLVATYSLVPEADTLSLQQTASLEAFDWILDVSISPDSSNQSQKAALLTAHNALLVLDLSPAELSQNGLRELTSNSKCILYSAHLHWVSLEHILIASGTVFGEIIVWSCVLKNNHLPTSILHHVLAGHDGSIFGVQVFNRPATQGRDQPSLLLASCSDDRTIRVWDISSLPDIATNPQAATDLATARETGFGANIADVLPDKAAGGQCIAKAWGHASRIWGVKFIPSPLSQYLTYLVSFGEDATCQFWSLEQSKSEQCSLVHLGTSAIHSGKNIWSWALRQDSSHMVTVATGGADGSIVLEPRSIPFAHESDSIQTLSVQDLVSVCPEKSLPACQDKLRSYAFVDQGDLLITTDAGNVMLLKQPSNQAKVQVQWVARETSLRGYSVVTSVPHGSTAFLAGIGGSVLVYDGTRINELVKSTGKTAALFAQQLRPVNGGSPQTSLLITNVEAKTSLFLRCEISSFEASSGPTNVSQWQLSMPPAFIVTSSLAINLSNASEERTMLIIGSRSGSIAIYLLEKAREEGTAIPMSHVYLHHHAHGRDAVTDLAWAPDTKSDKGSGHIFSVGRDGAYAVHRLEKSTSDLQMRLINRTSLPLGTNIEGLHIDESTKHVLVWGFHSKQFIVFDATDEIEIMTVNCGGANRSWKFEPLNSLQGGRFAWTKASQLCLFSQIQRPQKVLSGGSHGREIKAVAVSPNSTSNGSLLFATGSEDTDIKLSVYHADDKVFPFRCLRTLRKHVTGIQQLEWSNNGHYLFSSGGFEEFFVWRVEAAPLIGLGVVCESVCPIESDLPDLRIMGFSVYQAEDSQEFVISLVRSDSTLRVYQYTPGDHSKWHVSMVGKYLTSCLTQCLHIGQRGNASSLITGGTDGYIAFWPLSQETLTAHSSASSHPSTLQWILRSKVHQNTIHCMTIHWLNSEKCLFLTGGDDNAIAFTVCSWEAAAQPMVHTLVLPRAHAAAVTGLEILGSPTPTSLVVATTSIDQRIKVWDVESDPQRSGIDGLSVRRKQNQSTAVADVSGLALLDKSSILICGVGMDVWRHE